MSHKIFDPNLNNNMYPTNLNVDSTFDVEKKLLISLKYEDTVFICSDRQYLANKLAICKYSSRIRKLVLDSDKVTDYINLPDICGYDFFLFKHFVYTNDLFPLNRMTHYYNICFIFESQSLMSAFLKYLTTDNGDIAELLEFFKFQQIVKDSNILNILLKCRKISLEKLRTSRLLIEMDFDELQKYNFVTILKSWGALEAFSFIEFWILHSKEKRIIFKDYLYSCVNLSSFDLKYSHSIPNNLFIEIVNRCCGREQLVYVKKIIEHRQNSIIKNKDCKNTINFKSFDIEFWRKQNIKKLTQECGDVFWFEVVSEWFRNNEKENVHYLVEMLQHVDFTQIDSSFLTSWVFNSETIVNNKNIFKFFIPYIKKTISETDDETLEQEFQNLEQEFQNLELSGNLPDTPSSLTSLKDFSNLNRKSQENINNELINDGDDDDDDDDVFIDSLSESIINHPVNLISSSNDTSIKNIEEESVSNDKSNEISRCTSNDILSASEEINSLSTEEIFHDITELYDDNKTNISQKNLETVEMENIIFDNHLVDENKSNVYLRKVKTPLNLKKYDNERKKNEIIYDLKVLMIGGVSGIKKEKLKPARNLFYSSKNDEYEYLPELNRDRKLTKIADYGGYLYAVGGKIYINGRWDSALEFCRYDKINECWNEIDTCLQLPRYEHDVAVIGDKMYIIGGNNSKKNECGVVEYDFNSEKFLAIESTINYSIHQHSNIVNNNVIYVVGGYKYNQSRLLQRFDPRIGKFEVLSVPFSPHLHSATVLKGERIYCCGGRQNIKETSLPTHCNSAYDIRSNKWIHLSPMPTARSGCGSSVIGDKIYVFGGFTKNGGTLKIVEKYDIYEDKWKKAKPMEEERGFFGIYTMQM